MPINKNEFNRIRIIVLDLWPEFMLALPQLLSAINSDYHTDLLLTMQRLAVISMIYFWNYVELFSVC